MFPPHSSWSTGASSSSAFRASTSDGERLVLDLDELGGVARELARLGDDRDDGLADVAHLADRERVVLDAARRASAAIWKNGSVRIATSSPVSVP